MGVTVSFQGYTPPARFDAVPWTDAQIEEATTEHGSYAVIDTISLGVPDVDPANPAARSFTTTHGTGLDLWYRVAFVDGAGNVSEPTDPIQNASGTEPTSTDYTTLALVKGAMLPEELSPGAGLDEAIAAAIPIASRAIDGICGQFFYRTGIGTNGEVRIYTARHPTVLDERHRLDPIVAIDSIDVDRRGTGTFDITLVHPGDYVLEPANAALQGCPYEEIRIHPRGRYWFPCWPQAIRITGSFGWPAIPQAVRAAAQLLSEEIVKLPREAPLGFTLGHIPGIDAAAAIRLARSNPKVMGYLQNENLIRFPVFG